MSCMKGGKNLYKCPVSARWSVLVQPDYRPVLAAILLLFSLLATAADQRGLFWEVTNGRQTAWMLGAVHTGKPDYYPLRKEIIAAFDHSDVLLVEMDENRTPAEQQQSILMRYTTYSGDDRIQNHLGADALRKLTQKLGEYEVPLQAVENRLPSFIALMLTSMQSVQAGYSPEWGIDTHLMQTARAQPEKKEIREIESFEQQIKLLAGLPQTEEIITDTLNDLEDNPQLWQDIERAWQTGDSELLDEKVLLQPLREDPDQRPLYQMMFFDRNPGMALALQKCMEGHEGCFMVVGAGHLIGAEGVVRILQQAGYHVTQK
jgi:uncharacterized protein YbaP (TraB family)